jgi:hypothetical protein
LHKGAFPRCEIPACSGAPGAPVGIGHYTHLLDRSREAVTATDPLSPPAAVVRVHVRGQHRGYAGGQPGRQLGDLAAAARPRSSRAAW